MNELSVPPSIATLTLISGGEFGIPGFGLYFQGVDICVRLSTGQYTWYVDHTSGL